MRNDAWFISQGESIISPFCSAKVRDGVISYGVSSYGYDARVANEFKIFTNIRGGMVDPKNFNEEMCERVISNDYVLIPPNGFALARTVERFVIPRDVIVICLGKSTYARCGIIINVTPLEPEWEGYVTIEISNTTPLPAKIYVNEGIMQCIFLKASEICLRSYKDEMGKYMWQEGIVCPKMA